MREVVPFDQTEAALSREKYQRWLIRATAVVMGGTLLVFIAIPVVALASAGPHVEPRWQWVWGDSGYGHLLDALDFHEPRWTDPEAIAATLRSPARSTIVNWVNGFSPVSDGRFLAVRQVIDGNRIECGIYETQDSVLGYWVGQRYRNWRDAGESAPPRPLVQVVLPADLSEGTHRIAFPKEFHPLAEFLALFRTKNLGIAPWMWGDGPTCLLVAKPASGEVTVLPLDWHNQHPRMGVHNDIERLFRDPVTGRLFGDGSHLRPFVLKDDPRELETWLR